MGQNNDFIKVSNPNMDELAELVSRAKGPVRSLREFAKECGVSASTLSRIINKENKGASSEKLIRVIAEKAAPESGVTLDALMGTNGMARILDSATVYRASQIPIERKFIDTILCCLSYIKDLNYKYLEEFHIGKTMCATLDIAVYSKTIKEGGYLWGLDLIRLRPFGRTEEGRMQSFRLYSNQILNRIGRVLPLFYNNNNNMQYEKISFVIADDNCYDYIVSEFEDYIVPFNMSFIKFNCYKGIIEDEYILKQPNGKIPESLLGMEENYE